MDDIRRLATHEFLLLTTFRRSGAPVATPMWFSTEGDQLVFSTPAGVGKLKRLRHTQRVEVQPCSRRGVPEPGTAPLTGTARIVTSEPERLLVEHLLHKKYRWQWALASRVDGLMARLRGRTLVQNRVALIVVLGADTGTDEQEGSRSGNADSSTGASMEV